VEILQLVVGLMLASVVLVGVGDRLRLPWPALMVVLVPGLGLTAAVALGAMVAPPDPVAVEAVAGPVRMPRRLLSVLQSEGLFNDATALVIFQTAVLATVSGSD
jgi:monovalent cation/hydrogen antiporter